MKNTPRIVECVWMTTSEAAVYTSTSTSTVYSWMKVGLRHARIGSALIRIHKDDLDEWMRRFVND